jgi:hypothetical protein
LSVTCDRSVGFSGFNLIQPTISLEMPVPSQGYYGFPSFPVVDWFCLFKYLWVLTFPLRDCSEFSNFVITLISSTNKTDYHDITVQLLKVVLNTINQTKIKLVNNQEMILSQMQNSQIATPFIFIHKYLLQTKCYFHWTLHTSFKNPWGK